MSIDPWYMLIVPTTDEDEDLQLSKTKSLTNFVAMEALRLFSTLTCKWVR